MPDINDFFSVQNTIHDISDNVFSQTENYLASIEAFARTTYNSIYVIDYHKQGFDYVSDNPLFLCGYTSQEVLEMGYEFYFKNVIEEDLNLLLKINRVGFNFYENLPLNDRLNYTITYDFHLKNQEGKIILINQKLTPLFLTETGKIWKAICIISLSKSANSGNIKILKKKSNTFFEYIDKGDFWKEKDLIQLNDREKEILRFSTRGFSIEEIAEEIFLSPDTVKFHRKKLFRKLDVSNISEAITLTLNYGLI